MSNLPNNEENFRKVLRGLTVEEQITFYKDYYDKIIKFDDYYQKMFPDWDGHFNTHCKLHDEDVTGKPSFGYNSYMNLWTCWGKCQERGHGSGRVVYFHYIYMQRFNPNLTILQAIKEIHKIFKASPTDRNGRHITLYDTLPYPKLYKTDIIPTNQADLTMPIPPIEEPQAMIDDSSIFTEKEKAF